MHQPSNFEISGRVPQYKVTFRNSSSNNCAYHSDEQLTNFCKCTHCLLPVCPSCVKLHTEYHRQTSTAPQFETLNQVFEEVRQQYETILVTIGSLQQQLLEVEKVKKDNEELILEKVKNYRQKIIKNFEKAMSDLEENILNQFVKEDQHLIADLSRINDEIQRLKQQVTEERNSLSAESGLTTVILYTAENRGKQYGDLLHSKAEELQTMLNENCYLTVDESCLIHVREGLDNYLQLGKMQWTQKEEVLQERVSL